MLNSFRQIQAAGFALSNPAEPQFINHGTSMYISYATIMSNGSTLIKAAAQGANGGRIIAAFNCPRGGPQMANTAFMALQTLDVQLQRAAGTKPYYDPGRKHRAGSHGTQQHVQPNALDVVMNPISTIRPAAASR